MRHTVIACVIVGFIFSTVPWAVRAQQEDRYLVPEILVGGHLDADSWIQMPSSLREWHANLKVNAEHAREGNEETWRKGNILLREWAYEGYVYVTVFKRERTGQYYDANQWFARAHQAAEQDNRRAALQYYENAVETNPRYSGAYNNAANILMAMYEEIEGQPGRQEVLLEEAISQFQRGIEADPEYAILYNNLGWALIISGRDVDEGLDLARRSLDLAWNCQTMDTIGWGYYFQRDYRRAALYIEIALDDDECSRDTVIRNHRNAVRTRLGSP